MALTPQQLQALFQAISSGNQAGFAGMTPDMSQDERNQWINTYGTGGTGYRDYLSWYGGQNGTSGQQGSVTPGQLNTSGSYPINPTQPQITPMQNPTGWMNPQATQAQATPSYLGGMDKGTGIPMGKTPMPQNGPYAGQPLTMPGATPGWQQYWSPMFQTSMSGASYNPQNQQQQINNPVNTSGGGLLNKPKMGGYSFQAPGWNLGGQNRFNGVKWG